MSIQIDSKKENFKIGKNQIFSIQGTPTIKNTIQPKSEFKMGKNDAKDLSKNSVEIVSFDTATTIFEDDNINDIYDFFASKGFGNVQIAAILGNFKYETANSFNPACNWERLHSSDPDYMDNEYYTQEGVLVYREEDLANLTFEDAKEKINGLVPKYGGIGFLQWTGGKFDGNTWVAAANGSDRKAKYLNWCNENHYEWANMDTQLEYFYEEYQEWDQKEVFEGMTNVYDAATYFCDHYEFPGDSSSSTRSEYASQYFDLMNVV